MKTPTNRLIDDYLRRLDRALRGVPRARRREVVEEITAHIADARAEAGGLDEAATRTLLDRLGDPEDIAAETRARFGREARPPGAFEVTAVVLLLFGGFVLVIGWLAGVIMLWTSNAWTTRDKVLGTLVVPGGLLTTFAFGGQGMIQPAQTCVSTGSGSGPGETSQTVCHGGSSATGQLVLFLVLLIAPLITAWWLMRQAQRAAPAVAFA